LILSAYSIAFDNITQITILFGGEQRTARNYPFAAMRGFQTIKESDMETGRQVNNSAFAKPISPHSLSSMVAITSGKILVTGGTGYIGAWIVKRAVDRGYSVIAA
jgi:FlaA1/EpsC-like NDP-sugar epimerase